MIDFDNPNQAWTIESQQSDVRVVRVDLYDQEGHQYGVDYYAVNGNTYPVYFRIYLTEAVNVQNGLAPGVIYLEPGTTEYIGFVRQNSASAAAQWRYQWEASPAAQGYY